jgi:hypothetical protein
MRVLIFVLGFLVVPLLILFVGGVIWLCYNYDLAMMTFFGLFVCGMTARACVAKYDEWKETQKDWEGKK